MAALKVILTLVALFFLIFLIKKKVYAPTLLIAISFIILFVYSIVTKTSVMGDASIGSWFLDIFEYIKQLLTQQLTGLGMTLLPLVGYATYMGEIKASNALTMICVKPLSKIKNPYVVLAATVILGALLMIAIPSQTGLTALLMITVYPILLSLGVSKVAAVAAIVLSGATDLGPAAPDPIYALNEVGSTMSMAEYFVKVQIPVWVAPVIIAAILCGIVNSKMDKKLGIVKAEVEQKTDDMDDVPKYYALFPLFPIILILIFSKLIVKSIVISVCGAVFVSWGLVIIFELIRYKSLEHSFKNSAALFKGMGNAFTNIMSILVGSAVFAAALQKIGGVKVVADAIASTSLPYWMFFLLIAICSFAITFCIQSPQAAIAVFTEPIVSFAAKFGLNPEIALFPTQITMGLGRSMSPIGVAINTGASFAGVDVMDVIKRNVIPVAGAWISASILWAIFLL